MAELKVVKRNGEVVSYDIERIKNAILKAIRSTGEKIDEEVLEKLFLEINKEVEERFTDMFPNLENIQDIVEFGVQYCNGNR